MVDIPKRDGTYDPDLERRLADNGAAFQKSDQRLAQITRDPKLSRDAYDPDLERRLSNNEAAFQKSDQRLAQITRNNPKFKADGSLLNESLSLAKDTHPDTEAEIRRAARITGVPPDVARNVPDETKAAAQNKQFDPYGYADQNPVSANFLSNPNNAAIAHDDTDSLAAQEALGRLVSEVLPKFKTGQQVRAEVLQDALVRGGFAAASKTVKQLDRQEKLGAPSVAKNGQLPEPTRGDALARGFYSIGQSEAFLIDTAVRGLSWGTSDAQGLVDAMNKGKALHRQSSDTLAAMDQLNTAGQYGGALNVLAELPSTVARAKNPWAVLGDFALEQITPSLAGAGVGSAVTAPVRAAALRQAALAEAKQLSRGPALPSLLGGQASAARVGTLSMGVQGAGMGVGADFIASLGPNAEDGQNKLDPMAYAYRKTFGSLPSSALAGALLPVRVPASRLATTALQTTIQGAGGALGATQAALAVGEMPNPVEQALEFAGEGLFAAPEVAIAGGERVAAVHQMDQLRTAMQQQHQEVAIQTNLFGSLMGKVLSEAGKSKLAERDPAAYADLVTQITEANGSVTEVYIDTNVLNQHLIDNDMTVDRLRERAPEIAKQLDEATDADGTIRMPVGEFAAAFGSTPDIADAIRLAPDMPTALESRQLVTQGKDEMQADLDRVIGQDQHLRDKQYSADLVEAAILGQLSNIGTFSNDYNQAAATLTRAFYETTADRVGMTAYELYQLAPITITAASSGNPAPTVRPSGNPAPVAARPDTSAAFAPDESEVARNDGTASVVGAAGVDLLHGSTRADLDLESVQIVRENTKQQRGKAGKSYGGLYLTSQEDAAQAENYASMTEGTPTVYSVKIKPNTKVLNKTGDVTRLSAAYIDQLVADGYGLVIGKDPRGNTEYVVIDKNAIESMQPRHAATDDNGPPSIDWSFLNQAAIPETSLDTVRQQHEGKPTWMKAPNGADTALTERQWLQVRTPEFIEWFGDWINDPKNASKVIDANGEPMVVYHGTKNTFDTFKPEMGGSNSGNLGHYGLGYYFSRFAEESANYGSNLMGVFLDIKKPFRDTDQAAIDRIAPKYGFEKEAVAIDEGWLMESLQKVDPVAASLADSLKRLGNEKGWEDFFSKHSRSDLMLDPMLVVDALDFVGKDRKRNLTDWIIEDLQAALGDPSLIYDYADGLPPIHYMTMTGQNARSFTDDVKGMGFDGVLANSELVAFDSTQIKSATGNTGAFNPQDPNILNQGNPDGTERAQIAIDPTGFGAVISLSERADFSSFAHELGHHFLELSMRLAEAQDAPVGLKEDMLALLRWGGHASTTRLSDLSRAEYVELHEKFAESFEQFLFTGKAPTFELRGVFQKFRTWMIAVYRNLTRFLSINGRADLSPEVRQVMSRMLAADEDIRATEQARNYEPLPQDALGMTDDEYASYTEMHDNATEYALDELERKSLNDLKWLDKTRLKYLRQFRAATAKARKQMRAEVAAEVAAEPVYRAMAYLRQAADVVKREAQDPKALRPEQDSLLVAIAKLGGLDVTDVESSWGTDEATKIRSGVFGMPVVRRNDGLSIESMAEALASEGYLPLDEHGKYDVRDLEDRFSDELGGVKHYSDQADGDLLLYAQEMGGMDLTLSDLPKAKLDLDYLGARYGVDSEIYKAISKGRYGVAMKGGLTPDMVAQWFGFESGDALVRALVDAEKPKAKIERVTDERMQAEHADLYDEKSIKDAIDDAVHNDFRARVLANELGALTKLLGSTKALTDAAKEIADNMVRAQRIRDVRPFARSADEVRAGKAALEALRKGQTVEAAKAKRTQLVQFHAARASHDALARVDKGLTLFAKIFGSDERLRKGRNMDMVYAVRAVLSRYGFGRAGEDVDAYLDKVQKYDPDLYNDLNGMLDGLPDPVATHKDLTIEDFDVIAEVVGAMWQQSRRSKVMMIDGKRVELETAASEIEAQVSDLKARGANGMAGTLSKADLIAQAAWSAAARMRRVESWAVAMDGGESGAVHKYIWQPIISAIANYRADKLEYVQAYLDLLKTLDKMPAGKIAAPELGYTFGSKQNLLAALMHTGNDSNFSKLLGGFGWGEIFDDGTVDTKKWDAFIKRMHDEGMITKKDWDFIQGVWDLFERTKPKAQKAHHDMYGYYFAEIEASGVRTPFGDYRGGYAPAIADPLVSLDAAARSEKEALEQGANSYMFPTTGRGFTKSRVQGYVAPLMLDIAYIGAHIDKVLRFSHVEPAIKDVGRLLLNRDLRNALERVSPNSVGEMLIPWLQRVARQQVTTPMTGGFGRFADRVMTELRLRAGLATMMLNVVNTLQQLTGFTLAAVKIDGKHMRHGFIEYLKAPREQAARIAELSPFMRDRMDGSMHELQHAVNEIMIDPSATKRGVEWVKQHGYFLQQGLQNQMDVIIWWGAYENAFIKSGNEAAAALEADGVIRQTQGSLLPEDVARAETGGAFMRMFTMFYSYFNMQANLLTTEWSKATRANGFGKAAPRLFYVYFMAFMIPAFVGQMIANSMRGDLDDDDDDEYMDDVLSTFFGAQARTLLAFVPIGGQLGNTAISMANDKPYDDRISMSPAINALESTLRAPYSTYDFLANDGSQKKATRDFLTAIQTLTGAPVAPLGKPLGYAASVDDGYADPSSDADYVRGLIAGR